MGVLFPGYDFSSRSSTEDKFQFTLNIVEFASRTKAVRIIIQRPHLDNLGESLARVSKPIGPVKFNKDNLFFQYLKKCIHAARQFLIKKNMQQESGTNLLNLKEDPHDIQRFDY